LKDTKFDGPSRGGGRLFQIRYKKIPICRIDYDAYPGTYGEKRLHIHLPPDMKAHIEIDPRQWF
jgi:hypothetical protein